jgi:hypothetical protein
LTIVSVAHRQCNPLLVVFTGTVLRMISVAHRQ